MTKIGKKYHRQYSTKLHFRCKLEDLGILLLYYYFRNYLEIIKLEFDKIVFLLFCIILVVFFAHLSKISKN